MKTGSATIVSSAGVKLPGGGKARKRMPSGKPSKYANEKTTYDGIRFASKREAARYLGLKAAEATGRIRDLELQPEFRLEVNGVLVCKYRADFSYRERTSPQSWIRVVEDAKGFRTVEYRMKKKLMLACWGIVVREV